MDSVPAAGIQRPPPPSPGSLPAAHGVAPSFLLILLCQPFVAPHVLQLQCRPLPCQRTSCSPQPPQSVHHRHQSPLNTSAQPPASWIQGRIMASFSKWMMVHCYYLTQQDEPYRRGTSRAQQLLRPSRALGAVQVEHWAPSKLSHLMWYTNSRRASFAPGQVHPRSAVALLSTRI